MDSLSPTPSDASRPTQPAATWVQDGAFMIQAPYRQSFNVEMRVRVPTAKFNRDARRWELPLAYRDVAEGVVRRHFIGFPENVEQAYRALWLLPGAPIEVVEAAFRGVVAMYEGDPSATGPRAKALAAFQFIKHVLRLA